MDHIHLVEAALFISGRAMSMEELQKVIPELKPEEIVAILGQLAQKYDDHGLKVHQREDGLYEMQVKSEFMSKVMHLAPDRDFSRAELQTLSLIAYDNPIKQSDVIQIRGNRGYDHVDMLLKRGFIRKEPFGHTSLIHITQKFLDYFGLKTSEEVKRYFAEQGVVVERPRKRDVEKALEENEEAPKENTPPSEQE